MFNLEEKISEWRKQMLAAGIRSPVPLEELEIHLREKPDEFKSTLLRQSEPSWTALAERSGDSAFGRTEIFLQSKIFRPDESGVAAAALPPQSKMPAVQILLLSLTNLTPPPCISPHLHKTGCGLNFLHEF